MEISEYRQLFPEENMWRDRNNHGNIAEGMLAFDDSADSWSGPFEGNYAYYDLKDRRNENLLTESEYRQRFSFSRHRMPHRFSQVFKDNAKSDAQLQNRLSLLTQKELKEYNRQVEEMIFEHYTVENPIVLYIAGNDDCSYSKFFSTVENAEKELRMLLSDQPLNFDLHVRENGFVFTN